MLKIEQKLSDWAIIPIIGIFSGGVKVLIGSLQTVTALVISLLLLFIAPFSKKIRFLLANYIVPHIFHGIGNIVAGSIEAIPIIGTVLSIYRRVKGAPKPSPYDADPSGGIYVSEIDTNQKSKFMVYKDDLENTLNNNNIRTLLCLEKDREKFGCNIIAI